jgi:hypothetical protein
LGSFAEGAATGNCGSGERVVDQDISEPNGVILKTRVHLLHSDCVFGGSHSRAFSLPVGSMDSYGVHALN